MQSAAVCRPCLLDTQYRMHPLVAEFASAAFYNGRLQNGVSHIHRKPPEGFPWPQRRKPQKLGRSGAELEAYARGLH